MIQLYHSTYRKMKLQARMLSLWYYREVESLGNSVDVWHVTLLQLVPFINTAFYCTVGCDSDFKFVISAANGTPSFFYNV